MDYEEDFVCDADHTSSVSPQRETETRVQWPHSAIKPVVAVGLTALTFVLNSSSRKLARPSVNSNSATQDAVRRCLFLCRFSDADDDEAGRYRGVPMFGLHLKRLRWPQNRRDQPLDSGGRPTSGFPLWCSPLHYSGRLHSIPKRGRDHQTPPAQQKCHQTSQLQDRVQHGRGGSA